MKNILYLVIFLFVSLSSKAQTTAQDFNRPDCAGQMHHLFSELDSGNVVILEFIMTCSSCIDAAHALETMIADASAMYPGKVRLYQFAYTNSYTCATMENFKNTNGFNSCTFDSGAAMVAYYGGFGMPTVAVVAGNNHDVLFSNVGFATGDTTLMGTAIRNFFASTSVNNNIAVDNKINIYPNPADDYFTVKLDLTKPSHVDLKITDIEGRIVDEIFNDQISGTHFEKEFNSSKLSNGTYFIRSSINNKVSNHQFKILR
jgi:hypothetical protein